MPDNHYLRRVPPIRPVHGPLPTPAAASGTTPAVAPKPGAAADFRIVDIPRESPGMYRSWPEACVVLVPLAVLAVLAVAMIYLLVRGWPW